MHVVIENCTESVTFLHSFVHQYFEFSENFTSFFLGEKVGRHLLCWVH
jgi:hypothetical protein